MNQNLIPVNSGPLVSSKETQSPVQYSEPSNRLLNAQDLLEVLFGNNCRPSIKWLRRQTAKRVIPYIKVGRRVFFDPVCVRRELANKRTVEARR